MIILNMVWVYYFWSKVNWSYKLFKLINEQFGGRTLFGVKKNEHKSQIPPSFVNSINDGDYVFFSKSSSNKLKCSKQHSKQKNN